MDDKEYISRYNELYALMERAYKDYYYIQTIGDIDNRFGFEDMTTESISHICELLKTDMCLLIWKTCIDTGSDTNTLKSFKNAVFCTYGIKPKGKYFQDICGEEENTISEMRKNVIAHNISVKTKNVKIDVLGQYLYTGINLLNDLCIKEKGAKPFSANVMLQIRLCSEGGFRWLLEKGAVKKEKKYKVITLCGSTKFKDAFMEAQKRLTLEGNIVISVGMFGHSGDDEVWTEGTKAMLDDMHKRKIDMADEIYVINVGGYIGESTKSEISYAQRTVKIVRYLESVCAQTQLKT